MRPSCSRSRSTCLASTESTSRLSAGRITSTRSRRSLQPTRQSPCSSWPRSTGGDTYFNRIFPWYDGKSLDSWNTISHLLLLRDRNMKMSQSVIPSIYELSLAKSQEMNGCGIFSLFFYFLGLTNSSSSRFQFSSLYLTSSTGLLLYSRESIEKEQWYNIVGWRRQVNLYVFQKKKIKILTYT